MTKATELRELASLTTISSGQIQFDTDIKISGDLITTGNTITITADTLNISDPNITLASGAANSAIADGAGITIDGASATINYEHGGGQSRFETNYGLYVTGSSNNSIAVLKAIKSSASQSNNTYTFEVDSSAHTSNLTSAGAMKVDVNSGRAFTINGFGRVGIGTSSPDTDLHIGDGTSDAFIVIDKPTSGSNGIIFRNGGNNKIKLIQDDAEHFRLYVNNDLKLSVLESGNVGIGSTNPLYKLVVSNNGAEGLEIGTGYAGGRNLFQHYNRATSAYVRADNYASQHNFYANTTEISEVNSDGIDLKVGSYKSAQVRHSIAPSLTLDFANSKSLDSRISFYRDGIASHYDSNGVIKYVNKNEPRFDHDPVTKRCKGLLVEEPRTNLCPDLRTWGTSSSAHLVRNTTDVVAPDGTFSAIKVFRGPQANYQTFNTTGVNVNSGTTYTFSWYGKENPDNPGKWFVQFNINGWQNITFLSSQFPYNDATQRTTDVGNGWYRFEWTFTSLGTGNPTFTFHPHSSGTAAGDTTQYQYYWGAQLEVGSFATSYIPQELKQTSRASVASYYDEDGTIRYSQIDYPRYGYKWDSQRWVDAGLIVEDAATNYFRYNHAGQINNYSYIPNCTPSWSEDVTAPDGSKITTKLVFSANGNFDSYQNVIPYGNQVTVSVYVKPPTEDTNWQFGTGDAPDDFYICLFQWANGVITPTSVRSGTEAGAYKVGNTGWWRIWATNDATDESGGPVSYLFSNQSGARTFYLWGMQLEVGFRPTSWIGVNPSSSTTRSADVMSSSEYRREKEIVEISGDAFKSFYNFEEATVYHEFEAFNYDQNSRLVSIDDGSLDNRVATQTNSETVIRMAAITEGDNLAIPQLSISGTWADRQKNAFAYEEGRMDFALNGTAASTDPSYTPPRNVNRLQVGGLMSAYASSGCHRKVVVYPKALTSSELVALTENN